MRLSDRGSLCHRVRRRGFTRIELPFDRLRAGRRRDPGAPGFTLIELLVVIAILALLVSILLPSLARAKEMASRVRCRAHLHGLVTGLHVYAAEFDDWLPGGPGMIEHPGWGKRQDNIPIETGLLYTTGAITDPHLWFCPNDRREAGTYTYSFTYNARACVAPENDTAEWPGLARPGGMRGARRLGSYPRPGDTIILAEENTGMMPDVGTVINDPWFIYTDATEPRHMGMSQAAWLDARAGEIPPLIELWSDTRYWPVKPD